MRLALYLLPGLLLMTSLQAAYITDKLVAGLYEDARVSDKPLKALPSGTPLEVVSRNNGFVKVRTPDGVDGWVEAAYLTDEKPAGAMLLDAQARISILQKQLQQAKGRLGGEPVGAAQEQQAADSKDLQARLAQARGQVSQLEIQLQAARLEAKKSQQQLQQAQQTHASETQQQQARAEQAVQQLTEQNELLQQRISKVADLLQIAPPVVAPALPPMADEAQDKLDWSNWKSNYWLWLAPLLTLIAGFIAGMALIDYRVRKHFGGVRF